MPVDSNDGHNDLRILIRQAVWNHAAGMRAGMYALKNHRQRRLNRGNGFNGRRAFRGFVLDDWPANCDNAMGDRVDFGCYSELGSPDGPARFRVSIRVK